MGGGGGVGSNAVYGFGTDIKIGTPTARFAFPGGGFFAPIAAQNWRVPFQGTLRNLTVRIDGSTAGAQTVVYELLVAGVPTGISVTALVSSNGGTDFVNFLPVAQGALLSLRMTPSAAHGFLTGIHIGFGL